MSHFTKTGHYWELRYSSGETSGTGSYGRLAEFKANVLNEFVKNRGIESVIEFGCGDGNQLSLADYPSYIGLDISKKAIAICSKRLIGDNTKKFYVYNSLSNFNKDKLSADLSLSLDVIFHLVEDQVYEAYMTHLFKAAKSYVIIYSSNFDKKFSSYERHRAFVPWIDIHCTNWQLIDKIDNLYPYDATDSENTSYADFYIYKKT
ncbi:MAG: class I SAM-dependent methyltransferase [Candidatus Roizmanbacteria bacterium]|nr:class I SAM-dependent methyltransferase [Candidatus Roizmanbacteria bacterium]